VINAKSLELVSVNFSYRKMLVVGSMHYTVVTLFTFYRDCFILIIDLPIKYSYLTFFCRKEFATITRA